MVAYPTRIFCCGNDDYKNVYYYTGLTGNTNSDASYYPEFNFNRIGSDNKRISGWSYLYSNLLALKEDGIYMIKYSTNGTAVSFPVSIMNRQVGCDMPDSIQIIKNFPVFANTQSGLWTIVGTLIESEKNVEPISSLINVASNKAGIPGLLDNNIALLQAATSFNDGLKYYLCVGSNCYVWDFDKSPFNNGLTTAAQSSLIWYYYTNVNAKSWAWINREVYYGDRSIGQLARFHNNKNDFGNSINAVWRSKLFNFGLPDLLKTISEVWFTTRAGTYNVLNVKYYSDDREITDTARVVTNSFSLIGFSMLGFTVKVSKFAPTIKRKPKVKKVIYFQLEYSNNVFNETLSLLDIVIRYMVNNKVKTR